MKTIGFNRAMETMHQTVLHWVNVGMVFYFLGYFWRYGVTTRFDKMSYAFLDKPPPGRCFLTTLRHGELRETTYGGAAP